MGTRDKNVKLSDNANARASHSVSSFSVDSDLHKNQDRICPSCQTTKKCSRRYFSEQAWTVLLLWREIGHNVIDKPICNDCYEELRDTLIDRNNEIEETMQQSEEVAKVKRQLEGVAS